jgi:hypothetical protein
MTIFDFEACQETLVLHADGTVECEGEGHCELDELRHELWVTCDELRCSCAGDEAPLDWLPLAA